MKDNISLEEKESRLATLNELVNKYSYEANKKFLNKKVKVLVLGTSSKDKTKIYGYTEENKLVNIEGKKESIGKIIDVLIEDVKSFSMDGKEI